LIHARKDYENRIKDTEEKIGPSEPAFFLTASDELFPLIVRFYAELADHYGRSYVSSQFHRHATAARLWQNDHRDQVKLPDMPADAGRY